MNELEGFLSCTARCGLMPGATPLHRLGNLEKSWGHDGLFVKRDDLTGIGPGGNKVRSLEYLLGEALEGRCEKVLVSGPEQSNLCVLTAAACRKAGLSCEVVHNACRPDELRGNLLLNHILGVKSHFIGNVGAEARNAYVEELYRRYTEEGTRTYVVRNGGTTGRGALGYTAAVPELMEQCKRQGIDRLTIFAPGGNGGVATGLIYGNTLMELPFRIVIVSVEDDAETLRAHIGSTMRELEGITGIKMNRPLGEVCEITDEFRGGGWGQNTEESEREVFEFARQEGIFVENVYNSKVLVGMRRWLETGKAEGNVCFLHTGGFGSLFAQKLEAMF